MLLHGYFRSAASWRVRIALNLKGIVPEQRSHHLRKGEQRAPEYLALNPQGFVPALQLDDGTVLTQSLAIIEWLDETHPAPPLLPADPLGRARVRGFSLALAADTHPLQNLKVLRAIGEIAGNQEAGQRWAATVNADGLAACEALLAQRSAIPAGPYCFGATPGLADICLVPQLGNARRFGVDVGQFPRLLEREAACNLLPAFADAAPGRQPDAE